MVKLGMVYYLSPFLGWFTMEHFFPYIGNVITPTDFHIFQDG